MLSRSEVKRAPAAVVRVLRRDESGAIPETGAVQSVQEAEVVLPEQELRRLWREESLERLARAYWRFLSRISLSLIRVVYAPESRTIVLLSRRLPLLRFQAPTYETSAEGGAVTWRIDRGLLVAGEGRGRGFLRIGVAHAGNAAPGDPAGTARLRVVCEVRNFYPWLRGRGRFARLGAWIYRQTQLRIHVIVCNAFLRSLSRLDLPPSRVGALAGEIAAPSEPVDPTAPEG